MNKDKLKDALKRLEDLLWHVHAECNSIIDSCERTQGHAEHGRHLIKKLNDPSYILPWEYTEAIEKQKQSNEEGKPSC